MTTISIAKDFSPTPAGRFSRDGPYSGEAFRKRFLEPALDRGETVTVELDGVAGLPSAFLEEAFGGLFRRANADRSMLQRVRVHANQAALRPHVRLVERYMNEAASRVSPG